MFPRVSVPTPYHRPSAASVIQLPLFAQFPPSVFRKTMRNTARGPSSTVTVASAVSASIEARTVTVPTSRPVTSPSSETCAVRLSPLDQATATSIMACPCWSLTVAVSWDVSPTSARTADSGEISIVVATGGSVPHPPPSTRAKAASPNTPRGFREEIRPAGFILPLLVSRCSARQAGAFPPLTPTTYANAPPFLRRAPARSGRQQPCRRTAGVAIPVRPVVGNRTQPFLKGAVGGGAEIGIVPIEDPQGQPDQVSRKRPGQLVTEQIEYSQIRQIPELGRDRARQFVCAEIE